jgi:hypothetical protein
MVWAVIDCQGKWVEWDSEIAGAGSYHQDVVGNEKGQEERETPEYFLVATSHSSNLIGSHTFPENHSPLTPSLI